MAKYNESTVQGESWTRSFQIVGSNEYGATPSIRFDEEDVIALSGGKVANSRTGSSVATLLTAENALTEFQLRNPETDEYIDAYAKYQDLFVLIHSLYFHLAKERDMGPQPYPSWTYNEMSQQWEAPVPKPETGMWEWDEANQEWYDVTPSAPA
jgi:hypothetical protein